MCPRPAPGSGRSPGHLFAERRVRPGSCTSHGVVASMISWSHGDGNDLGHPFLAEQPPSACGKRAPGHPVGEPIAPHRQATRPLGSGNGAPSLHPYPGGHLADQGHPGATSRPLQWRRCHERWGGRAMAIPGPAPPQPGVVDGWAAQRVPAEWPGGGGLWTALLAANCAWRAVPTFRQLLQGGQALGVRHHRGCPASPDGNTRHLARQSSP